MNNTKTTKRALLSSVTAMLICVAMLSGTTFAWFTDSASTAVNKIQAGTLQIGLEMKDASNNWVDAEGQTLGWVAADGRAQDQILWEPGCTYKLPTLKITNKGNLALQFKVLVNGISGDMELLNALEFSYNFNWMEEDNYRIDSGDFEGSAMRTMPYEITFNKAAVAEYMFGIDNVADADFVNGYLLTPENPGNHPMHIGYYTLQAHMKESAGNEYQGKALENMSITIVATQVAGVETDSFNDIYDKNAEYPEVVADERSLKNALAAGKDVRLGSDIVLTEPITINDDVEVIGDGNSVISAQPVNVAPTAKVNFKNVNFAVPDNTNHKASSVYASGLEGKVVFDGCTFTNPQWECIQITPKDGAEVIVTNCTFVVDGHGTYAQANGTKVERMLHIQNTDATGKYTAVITNNTFIGVDLCRNAVIDVDDIEAFANVTCGGNTFANHDNTPVSTMPDGMIYVNINGRYTSNYVATDTYAQFTQTPAAALHH